MSLPLLSLTITPNTDDDRERLERGLRALAAEDPTLHVSVDSAVGTSTLGAMGELHLEIAVDRLKREFDVSAGLSAPRVVYKEARFAQVMVLLEPVMRVEVIAPPHDVDAILDDFAYRRARFQSSIDRDGMRILTVLAPLTQLFGYAYYLRDLTRGRGTVTMMLHGYEPVDPPWA